MMLRRLSVLVVEDTPANQKVITTVLDKRGHRVTIAVDGREAMGHVARSQFDVILMDLQMPVMDGYQAMRAIRALESRSNNHTPIIALTANSGEADREACIEAGMDAYLTKPLDVAELISVLEATAEPRRLVRADTSSVTHDDVSEETVADLTATMKRLGGDATLLKQFVEVFEEDAPQLLQDLRSALARDDFQTAVRAAHSLRGLAANFNASSVVEQASLIEAMAKKHDLTGAAAILQRLSTAVSQLSSFLKSSHRS